MTAPDCPCITGCNRCEPPSEPVAVLFVDTTDSHEKGCACDTCIDGRAREAGDKVCKCGHSEYDHDLDHCLACPGNARCEEYRPRGPVEPGGIKHDSEKPRWDLVPWDAVGAFVDVLTLGARKYQDRNWEKGIRYGRLFAATQRHLTAWWQGQDTDPESGYSHLAHAACHILFALAFVKRGRVELDDRPGAVKS